MTRVGSPAGELSIFWGGTQNDKSGVTGGGAEHLLGRDTK
jgi:hypothetical protein